MVNLHELQSALANASSLREKRRVIHAFTSVAPPEQIEALIVLLTRDLYGHDIDNP